MFGSTTTIQQTTTNNKKQQTTTNHKQTNNTKSFTHLLPRVVKCNTLSCGFGADLCWSVWETHTTKNEGKKKKSFVHSPAERFWKNSSQCRNTLARSCPSLPVSTGLCKEKKWMNEWMNAIILNEKKNKWSWYQSLNELIWNETFVMNCICITHSFLQHSAQCPSSALGTIWELQSPLRHCNCSPLEWTEQALGCGLCSVIN